MFRETGFGAGCIALLDVNSDTCIGKESLDNDLETREGRLTATHE